KKFSYESRDDDKYKCNAQKTDVGGVETTIVDENITEHDYNNACYFFELFLTEEGIIMMKKLLQYIEQNIPMKETIAETEAEIEEREEELKKYQKRDGQRGIRKDNEWSNDSHVFLDNSIDDGAVEIKSSEAFRTPLSSSESESESKQGPDHKNIIIRKGQVNKLLNQIEQGQYDSVNDNNTLRFYGDFQFLNTPRFMYGPRIKIFEFIRILFPWIPLSRSGFYRRTKFLQQPKSRTDLCELCHTAHLIFADANRRGIQVEHVLLAAHQRECFKRDILSLEEDSILVLGDFKENFKLNAQRDQVGKDYFKQLPVTCLSFVVHTKRIKKLVLYPIFEGKTKLIWWSDCGPHIHSKQFNASLDEKLDNKYGNREFEINHFVPSHGKSE
ncbi:MAG: hypothetical protein EZS28_044819, partial [Streblomastix strix]